MFNGLEAIYSSVGWIPPRNIDLRSAVHENLLSGSTRRLPILRS